MISPAFPKIPDYIIVDDLVSETYQEWLISLIKDENLMWHRKDSAIMDANSSDPRNGFCNFHYMYECDKGGNVSPLCNAFVPMALNIMDKIGAFNLMRMRINCVPAMFNNVTQLPHIDSYVPDSWNVIYYMDDSDGDTVIYNERTLNDYDYNKYLKEDNFTEKVRVTPKRVEQLPLKATYSTLLRPPVRRGDQLLT
ncbi:MAG: hypothetical protein CM15mV15_1880 [uncultured marine virus]|nr:MAG: hypothetical protein CM15mV15_1880 [uncultured marine virus]